MNTEIFLVDNDLQYIKQFTKEIENTYKDMSVVSVCSAREALIILSKIEPSVIIIEVKLSDMSGTELIKVIKESKKLKNVPIFVTSAQYCEPADRTEALLSGANGFFSKPINMPDLRKEIEYINKTKNMRE